MHAPRTQLTTIRFTTPALVYTRLRLGMNRCNGLMDIAWEKRKSPRGGMPNAVKLAALT